MAERRRRALTLAAAVALTIGMGASAARAAAGGIAASPPAQTGSDFSPTDPAAAAVRPTGPTGPAGAPTMPFADPAAGDATGAGGDPLVANGLGSPVCRGAASVAELSPAGAANCRSSGFVAAAAPIDDYAFDIHIDTGITSLSGDVYAIFEDLLLTPVWTAQLWFVQGVIVALEWCFSLDLLGGAAMGQAAAALRSAQRTITQPWLVTVLAVAAVLAAYHGLVRRRIAQTLGEALLVLVMIAAGLWVIIDPVGTVGEASALVNSASLGTLGAVVSGDPNHAERSFDDALQGLFASAVEDPWCYLEFGNVAWCRDPGRLDPALLAAARAWARQAHAGSTVGAENASLVAAAHTNGDLFLAFPANGPVRNSINDPRSLLAVLCRGPSMSSCHGATASEAEFRTPSGAWNRAGGLLFIVAGSLGMIALLGFVALRLLGAALCTLLYLLLAPVAVLAPALGEGGRGAFRRWALRLIAALLAKLLYSVLLGVVLLVFGLLADLGSLGWWTQWLLSAAFWWIVFLHRHQLLEFTTLGQRDRESRPLRIAPLRHARDAAIVARAFDHVRGERRRPPPSRPEPRPDPQAPSGSRAGDDGSRERQERDSLRVDHREATRTARESPRIERELADGRERLVRIDEARASAAAGGDRRRALRLTDRRERLASSLAERERALANARERHDTGRDAQRRTGQPFTAAQLAERRDFLDRQARLPRGAPQDLREAAEERRDYATLAPIVGVARADYERASRAKQLATRARIDRELEQRPPTTPRLAPRPATVAPPRPRGPLGPAGGEQRRRDSPVLRRERQFADALRSSAREERR